MRLFVLITVSLLLSSCSFEQDTRLVCDYEKGNAGSVLYNVPLVINESQKKLVWNGIDYTITSALKTMVKFQDNYIIYNEGGFGKSFQLDRVNLEFVTIDRMTEGLRMTEGRSIYQCRVVEGV